MLGCRSFGSTAYLRERTISVAAVATSCFVVLVLQGSLMWFAVPYTDDFCRATTLDPDHTPASRLTTLEYVRRSYVLWTGRWATMLLHASILPKLDLVRDYWVLLTTIALLQFGLVALAFRRLLDTTPSESVLLSMLLHAVWLCGRVRPHENRLWATGAIEYQLTFCSLALFPVLLLGRRRWFRTCGVLMLAFVIPGQHELAGLALVLALGMGLVFAYQERWSSRPVLIAALVVACAGLYFSLAAPGNAVRAEVVRVAYLKPGHTMLTALQSAVRTTLQWLLWPTSLPALAVMLFVPFPGSNGAVGLRSNWAKWTLLMASVGMPTILEWVVIWKRGELAYRVGCWVYLLFLFVAFPAVRQFHGGLVAQAKHRRTMSYCAIGWCLLTILVIGGRRSWPDLRLAASWREAYVERQLKIRGPQAVLSPLPPCPRSLRFQEISSNPGYTSNRCFAAYVGVESAMAPDQPFKLPPRWVIR